MTKLLKFGLLLCLIAVLGLSGCQVGGDGKAASALDSTSTTPSPQQPILVEEQNTPQGGEISPTASPSTESAPVEADDTQARPGVTVDINVVHNQISPLIYGVSGGDLDYLEELKPTLLSWGGNPSTRYNWKLGNTWNAGSDWYYQNGNYGNPDGVLVSDDFIRLANSLSAETRLAVPTLGWVAKDRTSCSFPNADGTCGNARGATCEEPGEIADPTRANVVSDVASIVEWMNHLKDQDLLPRFIAMDNEPELWGYTHYDVHPDCTTFEEVLDKYLAYASAIREVAPNAELTGPVACCWYSYWNTAPGPDETHARVPTDYIGWFLYSVRKYDEAAGQRHLDVLDVHFYPQGDVFTDQIDPQTAARRLRSTRALWDKNYVDESWIDQPIYFIPRMQKLIDKYYPGTKLGISEWNWGADNDMNGALAIADVLGIYSRENVYFAAYWRNPPAGSPGFYAFKMYTNYDDQGGQFSGDSVLAETNTVAPISSYAAYDSKTGRLQLMVINKGDAQESVYLNLKGFTPQPSALLYRYDPSQPDQIADSEMSLAPGDALLLPPYSISLYVLQQ